MSTAVVPDLTTSSTKTLRNIPHWIGGKVVYGTSGRSSNVYNPATGHVQATLPLASRAELDTAVKAAQAAFPEWSAQPPLRRARVLFRFRELFEQHLDEFAALITSEHGKVLSDAKGEATRGLEVVEFATGIPQLLKGEFTEQVGSGIDSWSMRQPLGVVAGITPFNFPAMVPMWMFPIALACGNTFVLKPSERDPSPSILIAELLKQAVMPDADLDQAADALVGAAYGSAGERCMAISVAVAVTNATADALIDKLTPRIAHLQVSPGTENNADIGPLVTGPHLDRVKGYVELGTKEGATLVIDGRATALPRGEGFFLGACLFDHVKPEMRIYREEIFGHVLCIVRANTFETALKLINEHEYGNGTAIFTRDGDTARTFAHTVKAGMVGVNVPIPVPMAFHSFGGWKRSLFGDHAIHGPEGVRFYTRIKTITARWPTGIRTGVDTTMPTLG